MSLIWHNSLHQEGNYQEMGPTIELELLVAQGSVAVHNHVAVQADTTRFSAYLSLTPSSCHLVYLSSAETNGGVRDERQCRLGPTDFTICTG